jgi:hypothetical protein
MTKVDRLIREMQEQGLTVHRRYVAGINDGDYEHSQNNDEDLCGLFVKNVAGKTATVVWHVSGPLDELFVIAENRLLETNIMDAFVCAFGEHDDED